MRNDRRNSVNILKRESIRLQKNKMMIEASLIRLNEELQIKKWELNHPYIDALHEPLKLLELVKICTSYLTGNFCLECNKYYFGPMCIDCRLCEIDSKSDVQEIATYTSIGKIKKVNTVTDKEINCYGYYFIDVQYNLFYPDELNDHEVINYWMSFTNVKFDDYLAIRCPTGTSAQLLGRSPATQSDIRSGTKISIVRCGYNCYITTCVASFTNLINGR